MRVRFLVYLSCIALTILAAVWLYPMAKGLWFISLAKRAEYRQDHRIAFFYYSKAYDLNQKSLSAVKAIALLHVAQNHAYYPIWVGKWAELEPKNLQPRLLLGKWFVSKGDFDQARICLQGIRRMNDSEQACLDLESAILVKEGKADDAIALLEKARESMEFTLEMQLNYAVLLLAHSSPQRQQQGEDLLRSLESNSELQVKVVRVHLRYLISVRQFEAVVKKAHRLLKLVPEDYEGAKWLSIGSMMLGKNLQQDERELLEKTFRENALYFRDYVQSVILYDRLEINKEWFDGLIESLGEETPVYQAQLAIWEALGEWNQIYEHIPDQVWSGDLDAIRNLYLIEANRRVSANNVGGNLLGSLVPVVRQYPWLLPVMDSYMWRWGWRENRIAFWEETARSRALPLTYVVNALRRAEEQKDLIQLYGLTEHALFYESDNPALLNNHIMYGLLLRRNVKELLKLAEANLKREPDSIAMISTCALAYHLNHRHKAAERLIRSVKSEARMQPEVAAYYVIIMSRQQDEAAQLDPYIARIQTADLLEEEQVLLDRALENLAEIIELDVLSGSLPVAN